MLSMNRPRGSAPVNQGLIDGLMSCWFGDSFVSMFLIPGIVNLIFLIDLESWHILFISVIANLGDHTGPVCLWTIEECLLAYPV